MDNYEKLMINMIQNPDGIAAMKAYADLRGLQIKCIFFKLRQSMAETSCSDSQDWTCYNESTNQNLWDLFPEANRFITKIIFTHKGNPTTGTRAFDLSGMCVLLASVQRTLTGSNITDRTKEPPTSLQRDELQQFNNAPFFYKRCCLWDTTQ